MMMSPPSPLQRLLRCHACCRYLPRYAHDTPDMLLPPTPYFDILLLFTREFSLPL